MSQIGSLHHDTRQPCSCEIIIKKIGVGPFFNLLRQISKYFGRREIIIHWTLDGFLRRIIIECQWMCDKLNSHNAMKDGYGVFLSQTTFWLFCWCAKFICQKHRVSRKVDEETFAHKLAFKIQHTWCLKNCNSMFVMDDNDCHFLYSFIGKLLSTTFSFS